MNLAELRDRMRSIANVDENRLPNDEAHAFLNEAKDAFMDVSKLRFGEAWIETAFTADTRTINPAPVSGRVLYPTKMWYMNSASEQAEVRPLSWAEYLNKYGEVPTSSNQGDPCHYSIYGEDDDGNPTFYLGPVPDDNVSPVYLTARITFPDLVEDDDHNQLTDSAGLALVYKALELAASFLENEERAPTWTALYKPMIARLAVKHSGARTSGRTASSMEEA